MNNPHLYNKSNSLTKDNGLMCLEEYMNIINWKKDAIIIDIGCGDGKLISNVVKKINCKSVTTCDKNENMIRFASEHYSSENLKFTVLDIEREIPDHLKGYFHQAFSFYALQLCKQEAAFQNIYNLLKKDGNCFAILGGRLSLYDAYRMLAKTDKWRTLLADAEKYISPYHDSKDPLDELQQLLRKIGFTVRKLEDRTIFHEYGSLEDLRDGLMSVLPFKIPDELLEDIFVELSREMHRIDTEKKTGDEPPVPNGCICGFCHCVLTSSVENETKRRDYIDKRIKNNIF